MHNTFVEASDGFEIRIASERDLESLTVALVPELSAAHTAQRFEESRSGIRTMLVATIDGYAVGTISIGGGRFQRQGSLRLFALNVGSAFRRKGVGTALVEAVEAIAADRDLDEVNLEVTTDNHEAISLYRKLGYRICGDAVMGRWERKLDDGSIEIIEDPLFVMVKRLAAPTDPASQLRSCSNAGRVE